MRDIYSSLRIAKAIATLGLDKAIKTLDVNRGNQEIEVDNNYMNRTESITHNFL